MEKLYFCVVLYVVYYQTLGAPDFEAEQVKSPYVDSADVGHMMSASGSSSYSYQQEPQRHYGRGCLSCQHGSEESSSHGYSQSYRPLRTYHSFSGPVQSSSSKHELKKKQEFINGQQIYDLHDEKKYKDGKLIKEEHREKNAEDFGVHSVPHETSEYGSTSYGSSSNGQTAYDTSVYPASRPGSSAYRSSSSRHGYSSMSQPSVRFEENPSAPSDSRLIGGHHQELSSGESGTWDAFHDDGFENEIERLRKEMERRTVSLHDSLASNPPYHGGSHRAEVRTEMKYVNGKPVYMKSQERKYKDGKLVHNATEEKGPHELGTAGSIQSFPIASPPARVYTSQYEEVTKSKGHSPLVTYPLYQHTSNPHYSSAATNENTTQSRYQSPPYTQSLYSSHIPVNTTYPMGTLNAGTKEASYMSTYHQSPHYVPRKIYESEIKQEHEETHTSTGYHPGYYPISREGNSNKDGIYQTHQPNSYQSPQYIRPDAMSLEKQVPVTTPKPSAYSGVYGHSSVRNDDRRHYRPLSTVSDDDTADSKESERDVPRSQANTYKSSYYSSQKSKDASQYQPSSYGSASYDHSGHYYDNSRLTPNILTSTTMATPTTASPRYNRPVGSLYGRTDERHREVSQSTHYDSKPSSTSANIYGHGYHTSRVQKTDGDDDYSSPSSRRYESSYSSKNYEGNNARLSPGRETQTQTFRSYQPGGHTSTVTTKEETHHQLTPSYYPSSYSTDKRKYMQPDYNDEDDDGYEPRKLDDENLERVSRPTSNVSVPGVISGPSPDDQPDDDEVERYDISPLVDGAENEIETNEITEEDRPYSSAEAEDSYRSPASSSNTSASHYYSDSRGQFPRTYPKYRGMSSHDNDQLHGYSQTNSTSRTDHRSTTVLPSKWTETKTTRNYVNGRLVSETQYHRYYENGVLIHENTTQRTRNEMASDGIDVYSLDLTAAELAQYGPTIKSESHSQRREFHQIQRFLNGQQIYEMNHERLFQDGDLVHENTEEKDEDDFEVSNIRSPSHHYAQSQEFNQQVASEGYGSSLHQTGTHHSPSLITHPRGYARRYDMRQEEEYINGQKVYDLHHEREYEDGKLTRENRTELGPQDLGAHGSKVPSHSEAMRDLLEGRALSSDRHKTLHQQQRKTENILTTECLTCGGHIMASGASTSGSVLGTLAIPVGYGRPSGKTFRHDVDIEEHYENGKLVKGREDNKKWRDEQLIDEKTEHYFNGPSRAGVDLPGSLALMGRGTTSVMPGEDLSEEDLTCSYSPCQNGGRCKKNGRAQVCVCSFGFRGSLCENVYCPVSFCRYGGSCSASRDGHHCSCPEGYTGHRCMTRVHKIRVGASG